MTVHDPVAGPWRPATAGFLTGLCLFAWVVSVIFFQPGSIGADPTMQWYEARTGVITSMHPPFTAFLWHWLGFITPNPGIFLALQLGTFWLAVGALLRAVSASRIAAVAGAFCLASYPFLFAYSAVIIKDVSAGNFALLGFCILLNYRRAARRDPVVVAAFASFAVAGLMRYQLWVTALPALAALAYFDHAVLARPRFAMMRRCLVAVVALVVPVLAAQVAMKSVFTFKQAAAERLVEKVLLYDVAAAVARVPDIPLRHFAEIGVDVDGFRRAAAALYRTDRLDYLWDPVDGSPPIDTYLSHVTYADEREEWQELLAAYPLAFLQHRIDTFLRLLGIGDLWSCYPLSSVGFPLATATARGAHVEILDPNILWRQLPTETLRPAYAEALLSSRIFPAGTFLFRPVTYLVLSLVLAGLFMRQGRREAILPLSMLSAGWCYWLSFAATPVACDVRYSYFSCAAALLVGAYWVGTWLSLRRARSTLPRAAS